MGKVKELLDEKCYYCDEPLSKCGHVKCDECGIITHGCAGCDDYYCECTVSEWGMGKDGITYCSQQCADENDRFAASVGA
ncbi:MAG: hypothetical protein ABR988_01145 [Terriglobales bacterium]|jgi:hypothetical protein